MKRWIVTFFGAGLVPVAPGTAGSLAACIVLAMLKLPLGQPPACWLAVLLIGLVLFSGLSVWLGEWGSNHFGKKDPGPFVLDEVAGICLTALFQPITMGNRYWRDWLIIFAAFRVFDILKLPPARKLEQLPHGWGILLDDLAAAVYANLACQIVFRFVFHH